MKTQCPYCSHIFIIPKEYLHRSIKCLKCKKVFSSFEYIPPPPKITPDPPPACTGPVKCPKCGSEQITASKKGFSGGKAVGGALLLGPLGILTGLHGSKKIMVTCLNCGHTWEAGKHS